ncbi:MAG TPA: FtsX-like permease family protein, partial [Blastocatellia bacterium]|nr:FtsX-like permease family protein [Blastocatellia bacterium]
VYMPYARSSREHLSFVVRTAGDPLTLASSVRAELPKLDKDRAMGKLRPMTDYMTRAMAPTNFVVVLAGIFAGLALLLATIGIYGVISYSVSQRSHEIGVRMALGARPSDIQKLVLREGIAMTVLGLGLGFASSLITSRYLQNLLFQVPLIDPATYGVMIIAVLLATILACWKPAHKASSVNPMQVLRG